MLVQSVPWLFLNPQQWLIFVGQKGVVCCTWFGLIENKWLQTFDKSLLSFCVSFGQEPPRDIWQKYDQLTSQKVAPLTHADEWRSFQSTSSLPCSAQVNTVQAQYPRVARSLWWLMSRLTAVSNMEEIVNQLVHPDADARAAVVWKCCCRKY